MGGVGGGGKYRLRWTGRLLVHCVAHVHHAEPGAVRRLFVEYNQ